MRGELGKRRRSWVEFLPFAMIELTGMSWTTGTPAFKAGSKMPVIFKDTDCRILNFGLGSRI